jgi:hypothetical protein
MASRLHNIPPLLAVATFILFFDACAPSRVFEADGPILERTFLPPLVCFRESAGRWPATKEELESFCGRHDIDMNPGFWRYVRMAPLDDTLVTVWHRDDDYVTQRWRWVNGEPTSEAIEFDEALRVLERANPTKTR